MPVNQPEFERAIALHQRGQLHAAEELFRSILQTDPAHFDAAHRLGVIYLQRGMAEQSVNQLGRAIELNPSDPNVHKDRGLAFKALGRNAAAVECFDSAIALKPTFVEAHFNRGVALKALMREDEAIKSFETAISLKPDFAAAHFWRGNLFLADKRAQSALECYDAAIKHNPSHAYAHNNRGNALRELNLVEDAVASYDAAIALKPGLAIPHLNRAQSLQDLGRFDEAFASYDRAIAIQPAFNEARKGRGTLELLLGELQKGFADFEFRLSDDEISAYLRQYPLWSGQDLAGKSIFIYGDGAFGDLVQFCRYLPLLAEKAAQVAVLLPEKFHRVLSTGLPGMKFVSSVNGLDAFDFRCELMSLPFHFKTDLTSIPRCGHLIRSSPSNSAAWAAKLNGEAFNVGICWQGNPSRNIDRGRSIPLIEFEPISQVPGVRLVSLQKLHGLDQLLDLPSVMQIGTLGPDFDKGADAFVDAADVISALDLVITSDTAIAHLSAALGRPTWIALKFVPEWRWLMDRSDSPWYPTVRLFRQQKLGQWGPVLSEIAAALRSVVAARLKGIDGTQVSVSPLQPPEGSIGPPVIPVSWGELIDKITILEIKSERIAHESAVANVRRQLSILTAILEPIIGERAEIKELQLQLKSINERLWDVENRIRAKEAAREFDSEFIELARTVYKSNDERGARKREIDLRLVSDLLEEKSYKPY